MEIKRRRFAQLVGLGAAAILFAIVLAQPLGTASPAASGYVTTEQALKDEAASAGMRRGSRAPGLDGRDLRLVDVEQNAIDLKRYRGHPVWVVFWATTCHACQLEESGLVAEYLAHRNDGLVVLAIDIGEPADVVAAHTHAHDLPYPMAIDGSGAAADAFGAIGTPTHFFVGGDGVIRERAFGRLARSEMERLVATIHAG